jgi:hypothetical protein
VISAGRPAVVVTSPRTRWGWKWVSRRIGEFAMKQTRGGNPGGAPHALNDLDSHPWSATPVAPMGRDTRAGSIRDHAPIIGGHTTIPFSAVTSARSLSARVSGSISADVAIPSRSMRGMTPRTTFAQPHAGASRPPATPDSKVIVGGGRPASTKQRYSRRPMRFSTPARVSVCRNRGWVSA